MAGFSSFAQPFRVGLALGGGGAKGAATIGALKVVEKAGIHIDYISGTSIGAILGGLYASGYTLEELETYLLSRDWEDILEGYRVNKQMRDLFGAKGVHSFSDTRIPFSCVATEYRTLKERVFSCGDIVTAVRASMSIPALYEPVYLNGVELVDGGLVNNLPADVVRDMGSSYVVAIDLEQDEGFSLSLDLGVGGLLDWFFSRPDIDRYQRNLDLVNIHIHPSLPGFTAMSFGRENCALMMEIGEREAMQHWDELVKLANYQKSHR